MNNQISILGTGWLGLPLATALIEQGYFIKGSTTSLRKLRQLKSNAIEPHHIIIKEEGVAGEVQAFLRDSELLIINIPPGLRRNPTIDFVSKIRNLIPHIEKSSVKNVIFVSSTSVYQDEEGFPLILSETIPNALSNAGKQLFEVEKLLQTNTKFNVTILRFGGLFDSRRHPANMLSRKTNIKNPKAPVNLIHLNDCIGVIKKIIETQSWNDIYNAAYPSHPEKSVYYSKVCKQLGLPAPDYDFKTLSKGKIIDSKKITEKLGYQFSQALS
ncbi:NAD(P)H-binding protein [Aquimarina sp. 2201CG5-10]|uniref:NAD(P)H-binding protein n=1 Tax=Aquimarina callyspongiae TaxID=3098150 RepID=UPI002AB39478|nr:NAD(P)H-binding protein [Aquimarina sp. 2201CG5-10]MDY8137005.1 NAD(P)H-binding protein [Aquimarina sp. 2201CG5-10]